jgi:gliding motility-associated-like protein
VLFPPPYLYDLYRVEGLNAEDAEKFGADTVLVVSDLAELDTTYVDTGIDTEDKAYHYFVTLKDSNGFEVVNSSSASSVELEPKPLFKEIELSWEADVPWSNNTQDFPMHYIFRDNVTSDENELVLIDSVDVNQNGFLYVDAGQFNGVELDDRTLYCYYVITQGSYGNDNINEPIINLSQIVCAQPNDTIPPCPPILEIDVTDCETFFNDKACNFNDYENRLRWTDDPDPSCEEEIKGYNIYYTATGEEESFEFLDFVEEMRYVHDNIPSFAGCYYVTAIDRSGNESEPSNIVCNDNCPNYDLPNVFTPNNDGFNDLFHALTPEDNSTEGNPDEDYDPSTCPRFVEKVVFRVFNRQGKEIYTYESGGENSILINWDGTTNDGSQLPSGIYYFSAEVEYETIDPAKRKELIKSWVQILK